MAYRSIAFEWQPRSQQQWRTFTLARQACGQLWNDLLLRHARIRRLRWKWPTKDRWEEWAKRRYPHLHSQSVQQTIAEFMEAVRSTRTKRRKGDDTARYPWRLARYRDVIYTNQAAKLIADAYGCRLRLPHGSAGYLYIRIPPKLVLPGRLIEVKLEFGRLRLTFELPKVKEEDAPPLGAPIGVDLGVNTLICATDGDKAVVISGRGAKATVQWRNKRLASLQAKQARHQRGSRRYKRLQKRKYRLLRKADNRIHDLTHKATHQVRAAFENAQVYVGEPFNDAAQKVGRVQAQQVSSACNRTLIEQLSYKTAGAQTVSEAYSSQTCPVCGQRRKCRRTYTCCCGYCAPRDVVGATNILRLGTHGVMQSCSQVPVNIVFLRPTKYLRPLGRSSSGGHPASSS
jgi:putative transposase